MRDKFKSVLLIILSILLLWSCTKTTDSDVETTLNGVWEFKSEKLSINEEIITINYPLELFEHFKPGMDKDIDNDGIDETYINRKYIEIKDGYIIRHNKLHLNDPGEPIDSEISKTLPNYITFKSTENAGYRQNGTKINVFDPTYMIPYNIDIKIGDNQLIITSPDDPSWNIVLTRVSDDSVSDSVDTLTMNKLVDSKKFPVAMDSFWEHDYPQNNSVDDGNIQKAIHKMNEMNLENESFHSFLLIRNGKLLYEYYAYEYDPNRFHNLFSTTKSFTSFLVGKAIEEGYIGDISDSVISYFPDIEIKKEKDIKSNITLEHLLNMTSGLKLDDFVDQLWSRKTPIKYLLNRPMNHEPGTDWHYSDSSSYLLTGIIGQTTGKKIYEYANEKLFNHLGITDYFWYLDRAGLNPGGHGLYMTSRDMAKFGYLYLNKGKWGNKQLINEEWISTSTKAHINTDWGLDMGYHWWVDGYANSFGSKGKGGQNIYVFPDHNAVVVYTANLPEDKANIICNELNKNFILPALN